MLLLSVVSALSIVACWRDVQHKHGIYCRDSLKLSGTNSETRNTSTAFTVNHWKWSKQCLSADSALSIVMCWRDTQHKHCGIYCDSLKVDKQYLLLLLSGVSALSTIATCWRDMQHKHCIYCDSLKVDQTVLIITIQWNVYT